MKINTVVVGPLRTNCYIVSDDKGKSVIIDPGFEEWKIGEYIKGLDIKYILLTHGHYDHFAAARKIIEKTGAKTVIHEIDEKNLDDINLSLICWNKSLEREKIKADITVKEGSILNAGDMQFTFIHTPGHTKGSMCIACRDALFTGDTLFCGDAGRTDLPGGSLEDLLYSFKNKLLPLDKNYKVYPGHLESTTLDEEKKNNMYFR